MSISYEKIVDLAKDNDILCFIIFLYRIEQETFDWKIKSIGYEGISSDLRSIKTELSSCRKRFFNIYKKRKLFIFEEVFFKN